jgi:hypothetical protein
MITSVHQTNATELIYPRGLGGLGLDGPVPASGWAAAAAAGVWGAAAAVRAASPVLWLLSMASSIQAHNQT